MFDNLVVELLGDSSPICSFPLFKVVQMDIIEGLKEYGRLVGRGEVPPLNPVNEKGWTRLTLDIGEPKNPIEKMERIEKLKTFYNPPE